MSDISAVGSMRLFHPSGVAVELPLGATPLVYAAPKPFGVVWKDNPKYDPNEQDTAKKKPKRLFVRWADVAPQAAVQATPQSNGTQKQAAPVAIPQTKEPPRNGEELRARID